MTIEYVKQYASDENEVLCFVNKLRDMFVKETLDDATVLTLEVFIKFN